MSGSPKSGKGTATSRAESLQNLRVGCCPPSAPPVSTPPTGIDHSLSHVKFPLRDPPRAPPSETRHHETAPLQGKGTRGGAPKRCHHTGTTGSAASASQVFVQRRQELPGGEDGCCGPTNRARSLVKLPDSTVSMQTRSSISAKTVTTCAGHPSTRRSRRLSLGRSVTRSLWDAQPGTQQCPGRPARALLCHPIRSQVVVHPGEPR